MLLFLFNTGVARSAVPLPEEDPAGAMRTADTAASEVVALQKWAMKTVCSTATCHPKTKRVEAHVQHQLSRWLRAGYDPGQVKTWTVRYAKHLATPPPPGPRLPFQEAQRVDGGTWTRAAKPTVVTFGSSWVGPFVQVDLPILRDLAATHRDVDFVTVVYMDEPEKLQPMVKTPQVLVLDPSSRMSISVGVTGTPEHFFIDADGFIIEHQVGLLDAEKFRYWLGETNE